MKMPEQVISRVLFPVSVTLNGIMAIHLVQPLPAGSSDIPGDSDGPPSNVPLLGLAPGGVCRASAVTNGAVSSYLTFSPLPHQTNKPLKGRYIFCGTFLPVAGTPCYGAPCPVEPGLSSLLCNAHKSDHLPCSDISLNKKPNERQGLRALIASPVYDPVTIGTALERCPPDEVVILLRRNPEVTPLTDEIDYWGHYPAF